MIRAYLKSAFEKLFKNAEKQTTNAFIKAAEDIKDRGTIAELEAAIENRDADEVIRILGIDASQWENLADVIAETFFEAAKMEFEHLAKASKNKAGPGGGSIPPDFPLDPAFPDNPSPVNAIRVQFDRRNPRVEAWLSKNSSDAIVEISNEQKFLIREILTEQTEMGLNPKQAVQRLVGYVNPKTGSREGGVIGLTRAQAGWVDNAAAELYSGRYSEFLERRLRNKTYDKMLKRAIKDGTELPPETLARIMASYENKMLQHRAETIGRTEVLRSMNAAKYEAAMQGLEASNMDESYLVREWSSSSDGRVRETHRSMNRSIVIASQPFTTPTGYEMMFPGDNSLGAPAEEVINCRCMVLHKIDYAAYYKANRNGIS